MNTFYHVRYGIGINIDTAQFASHYDSSSLFYPTFKETIDQMGEFEASLTKMSAGNISLIDEIGSAQLAIQSAIRSHTSPEILKMFMKKEHGALRAKLSTLESELKLGQISHEMYAMQAIDLVKMLDKLGVELSPVERDIFTKEKQLSHGIYVPASNEIGNGLIDAATRDIGNAAAAAMETKLT